MAWNVWISRQSERSEQRLILFIFGVKIEISSICRPNEIESLCQKLDYRRKRRLLRSRFFNTLSERRVYEMFNHKYPIFSNPMALFISLWIFDIKLRQFVVSTRHKFYYYISNSDFIMQKMPNFFYIQVNSMMTIKKNISKEYYSVQYFLFHSTIISFFSLEIDYFVRKTTQKRTRKKDEKLALKKNHEIGIKVQYLL